MRAHLTYQFCSCERRDLPSGPRALPAHKTQAWSWGPAEGRPGVRGNRCAGDPGGSEDAATRSEEGLNDRPRLAPSAKGPRALEPWGAGWRDRPGPAGSGNTRSAQPRSGSRGGAGGEAGPAASSVPAVQIFTITMRLR